MTIAVMQPYFFPYLGYYQLITAVDEFVIYDNIEFSKKGWINRNRILVNGRASYITLPLKKDSDYLDVKERCLAEIWRSERNKMLNKIRVAYKRSPNFNAVYPVVETAILFEETNLFRFILNSLNVVAAYLEIKTPLIISSSIEIDHSLKGEAKVLSICDARGANIYLNSIGGIDLYNKNTFKSRGIDLHFLKSHDIRYEQFNNDFVSSLSIVDVLMFNPKEKIQEFLKSSYEFI
ncbi:MAG: WbqC family protein [Bacteroidetes bacterium]|nr:WbqC family protein [Bacteroidota bacterium]